MITTGIRTPSQSALQTINLSHLKHLTTDIGVWQHCKGSEPNVAHGYSIDDVARALIVAVELWRKGIDRPFAEKLGPICLSFLEKAILPHGKFHNFADADGNWVDSLGSEDSFGRTLWALALAHQANLDFAPAKRIQAILDPAMKHVSLLGPLRSRAFVLQALSYLPKNQTEGAAGLLEKLENAYRDHWTEDWQWYEPTMTYCNARVPLAMLLSFKFSRKPEETIKIALTLLDFLLKSTAQPEIGGYAPVGNEGWFHKGDVRPPLFDQQPVDAGVLVEACVAAFQVTEKEKYAIAASEAMEWYYGRNIHNATVYIEETGGVCDALTHKGLNLNQGAESILSYCMAAVALDNLA